MSNPNLTNKPIQKNRNFRALRLKALIQAPRQLPKGNLKNQLKRSTRQAPMQRTHSTQHSC